MANIVLKKFFELGARLAHMHGFPEVDCPVTLETILKNTLTVSKNAQQARSPHQRFSGAWAKAAGMSAGTDVELGPQKTIERIAEKGIARYQGDVFQVSDTTRSRILIDTPKQIKPLRDVIASHEFRDTLKDRGIVVLSVEDRFASPTPTGWRGLVAKTEIDLGKGRLHKAETIVIPRDWVDDYEITHKYLDNIRSLKDLVRAQGRELTPEQNGIIADYTRDAMRIHLRLAARDGYLNNENDKGRHLRLA